MKNKRDLVAGIFGCARAACLAACLMAATAGAAETDTASRDVLVFGGTGKVGARVVKLLIDNGDRVTVFARPESDRRRIRGLRVDYAIGDVMNDADIGAAMRDRKFDIVIIAVRLKSSDTNFYGKFMTPLTVHARAIGVSQIILHSGVGAGSNVEKFAGRGWEKMSGLMDRLRDQGIGEDILRASGVPYTIIRNAGIYPDDAPATGTAVLTEDDTVLSSMTRADLALLTLQCFGNVACLNKTYHVSDPSLPWRPPQPDQDSEGG